MKILQVVAGLPSSSSPAVGTFIASQIRSLRDNGVDLEILDLSLGNIKGFKRYLFGIPKLRRTIRFNHYDIIHAHYSYCGWVARSQRDIPIVVSLMGSDLQGTPDRSGRQTVRGMIDRWSSCLLSCHVDHTIVKSYQMAQLLPNRVNVSIIPNGVDFNLFKPMNRKLAREHFGFDDKQKIVLFVANPKRVVKNFPLAQEAVNLLNANNVSTDYFLWPFFNQSHAEVCISMNAADVLLVTSFSEGSCNVIKEAMACNTPIVSVRVGDVPDIIMGARNCYLAEYDPDDIAEKLFQVITVGGRSDGRQNIEYFRIETIAQRLIELYNSVISIPSRVGKINPKY
jgi:glycosyltransferase involved in cell wall biosynthesis